MKKWLWVGMIACSFSITGMAQRFYNGFNFYLPPFDSVPSPFLPDFPAKPITAASAIRTSGDGQFFAGNTPIRFWGVNIVAAGAFVAPSLASGVAARMRKFGINLVRFHHLDNPGWSASLGTIFGSNGTRTLNPITVDRIDYLLAQFKRNGIYADMNLHVSRTYQASDGVIYADSLADDFGKIPSIFDPYLQKLEKEYAQQLLGHVNPYTGLSLAQDPVLGMVEILNESSLYGAWKDNALKPYKNGGKLIQRHSRMLDSLWHDFLRNKYQTDANLATAWNQGAVSAGTSNQVRDGGFESGIPSANWYVELHETAAATVSPDRSVKYLGNITARVDVNKVTGTDWHIQFKQAGFSIKKDSTYGLVFSARSDVPRKLNVALMRDNSPYNWYTGASFNLTTQWQTFRLTFKANEDNINNGRISFSFDNQVGKFWFDEIGFGKPEKSGLAAQESLVNRKVKRVDYPERLFYTDQRGNDLAAFYIETQQRYFDEMRRFLLEQLGVKAPITGTNALVGAADILAQKNMDFIDDHSYWDHPQFPGVAWDSNNWLINNESSLGYGMPELSSVIHGLQPADKPFTISEFNHAFPNRFRTEMVPSMAAYAAFHGVDGIMFFDYNGDFDWFTDKVSGYFSIHRDNSVMSLFPSCAYAYRQGLIAPAQRPYLVDFTPDYVYGLQKSDNQGRWGKFAPYDLQLGLTNDVKVRSYQATQVGGLDQLPAAATQTFSTDNQQTTLSTGNRLLITQSPAFVAITGYVDNVVNTKAGPLTLAQADGFAALTWVSTKGDPLATAKRSLITISTKLQNTGMQWQNDHTLNSAFGNAPSLMAPLQAYLRLELPAMDSIRLFPLSATGQASDYTTLKPTRGGIFELAINLETSKTLWYGIEAFGKTTALKETPTNEGLKLQHFPNPVRDRLSIRYELPEAGEVWLSVYDLSGRQLAVWLNTRQSAGKQEFSASVKDLAQGAYFYRLETGGQFAVGKFVVE